MSSRANAFQLLRCLFDFLKLRDCGVLVCYSLHSLTLALFLFCYPLLLPECLEFFKLAALQEGFRDCK